ncbi:MAG: LysR family transcriptional regulator [Caulobacter sp.]
MDWNDLRVFLAVARQGSALGAATELQVNQTTVGRRLDALERALGLKLIERSQAGSRLTAGGEKLLPKAEKIEAEFAALWQQVGAFQRDLSGTLRLTLSDLSANMMMPALADFRTLYPEITVELIITDRFLDIAAGEADIAMRGTDRLEDSDLVARKLAQFEFAICCSRAYAARHGIPGQPEELKNHILIGGEQELANLPILKWMFDQAPNAEVRCRSNSLGNLIMAVRNGLGVGPAPLLMLVDHPELVLCLTPEPPIMGGSWLVTRQDMKNTPRVRAFIDFFVPYFEGELRKAMDAYEAAQAKPY